MKEVRKVKFTKLEAIQEMVEIGSHTIFLAGSEQLVMTYASRSVLLHDGQRSPQTRVTLPAHSQTGTVKQVRGTGHLSKVSMVSA
jgi:hypothetical protein